MHNYLENEKVAACAHSRSFVLEMPTFCTISSNRWIRSVPKNSNQKWKIYPNPNPKFVYVTCISPKNTHSNDKSHFLGMSKNNVSSHPSLRCWSALIGCQSILSQLGQSTSTINIMFHLLVDAMLLGNCNTIQWSETFCRFSL